MTTRSRNCLRDVMSAEEERAYYYSVLQRVYCYPRFYLDNLDFLWSFRVSFLEYSMNRKVKPKLRKTKTKNDGL